MNDRRVNDRIRSRIDNRLSLRIERYKPGSENNPTAAFAATPTDGARNVPVVIPDPAPDLDQPQ